MQDIIIINIAKVYRLENLIFTLLKIMQAEQDAVKDPLKNGGFKRLQFQVCIIVFLVKFCLL